ncbi:MAG TPA: RNA 2',3'-cyclic phosphodiesterase [Anaerolineales bacterium]|nr:RNA 2',3'-cyclic phosphodiesterase [Anaerolineales bacterium]
MSPVRAFIALDIPAAIQRAIDEASADLRTKIGSLVRWVPVQNMHLTLKFLGDVPPASLDALTATLLAEADSCSSFDMGIGGLGLFPSSKRPRVIFIGIQAPAGFEALYRGIETACARLGYPPEARIFSPHLTIGRVRQYTSAADSQKIRHAIESSTIDSLGTARVDSVQLYKSDLKPDGAAYTRLISAPFHAVIASHEVAKQSPR